MKRQVINEEKEPVISGSTIMEIEDSDGIESFSNSMNEIRSQMNKMDMYFKRFAGENLDMKEVIKTLREEKKILKEENESLKEKLKGYEEKVKHSEEVIEKFKSLCDILSEPLPLKSTGSLNKIPEGEQRNEVHESKKGNKKKKKKLKMNYEESEVMLAKICGRFKCGKKSPLFDEKNLEKGPQVFKPKCIRICLITFCDECYYLNREPPSRAVNIKDNKFNYTFFNVINKNTPVVNPGYAAEVVNFRDYVNKSMDIEEIRKEIYRMSNIERNSEESANYSKEVWKMLKKKEKEEENKLGKEGQNKTNYTEKLFNRSPDKEDQNINNKDNFNYVIPLNNNNKNNNNNNNSDDNYDIEINDSINVKNNEVTEISSDLDDDNLSLTDLKEIDCSIDTTAEELIEEIERDDHNNTIIAKRFKDSVIASDYLKENQERFDDFKGQLIQIGYNMYKDSSINTEICKFNWYYKRFSRIESLIHSKHNTEYDYKNMDLGERDQFIKQIYNNWFKDIEMFQKFTNIYERILHDNSLNKVDIRNINKQYSFKQNSEYLYINYEFTRMVKREKEGSKELTNEKATLLLYIMINDGKFLRFFRPDINFRNWRILRYPPIKSITLAQLKYQLGTLWTWINNLPPWSKGREKYEEQGKRFLTYNKSTYDVRIEEILNFGPSIELHCGPNSGIHIKGFMHEVIPFMNHEILINSINEYINPSNNFEEFEVDFEEYKCKFRMTRNGMIKINYGNETSEERNSKKELEMEENYKYYKGIRHNETIADYIERTLSRKSRKEKENGIKVLPPEEYIEIVRKYMILSEDDAKWGIGNYEPLEQMSIFHTNIYLCIECGYLYGVEDTIIYDTHQFSGLFICKECTIEDIVIIYIINMPRDIEWQLRIYRIPNMVKYEDWNKYGISNVFETVRGKIDEYRVQLRKRKDYIQFKAMKNILNYVFNKNSYSKLSPKEKIKLWHMWHIRIDEKWLPFKFNEFEGFEEGYEKYQIEKKKDKNKKIKEFEYKKFIKNIDKKKKICEVYWNFRRGIKERIREELYDEENIELEISPKTASLIYDYNHSKLGEFNKKIKTKKIKKEVKRFRRKGIFKKRTEEYEREKLLKYLAHNGRSGERFVYTEEYMWVVYHSKKKQKEELINDNETDNGKRKRKRDNSKRKRRKEEP